METFFFDQAEWQRLYMNCSKFGNHKPFPTIIPWEQRVYIPDSIIMIFMATVYYALYIPCMFSIRKHLNDEDGQQNSCFTLLYVIGWVDMMVLWGITFFPGVLFLNGAVYCTAPLAMYLVGSIVTCFTEIEVIADGVLALNRCLDILSPYWAHRLFGGKKIWLWISLQTSYGLFYLWFHKPVVYNGTLLTLSLNPYQGFWDDIDGNFKNPFLAFCQFILAFSTPTIYTIFGISLWFKTQYYRTYGGGNGQDENYSSMTRTQFFVFLQIALISLMNTLAGGSYYLLHHFLTWFGPDSLSITTRIAHYCWINMHGLPPVLYILLNKTVRNDIRIYWAKIFKPDQIKRVNGVTMLATSKLTGNGYSHSNAIQPAILPSTQQK